SLLGKEQRRLLNTLQPSNAGADEDTGADLVLIGSRLPPGILQRLGRRRHRVDDELVDLALLLGFHPVVSIEGAVGAIPVRNLTGDLAGEIGDVEILDAAGGALAGGPAAPGCGLSQRLG